MPISQKIKNRIYLLYVDENFKELMMKILEVEDKGTYQYTKEYEKHVNEYLEKKSKGV
jgi:hypothetical protein